MRRMIRRGFARWSVPRQPLMASGSCSKNISPGRNAQKELIAMLNYKGNDGGRALSSRRSFLNAAATAVTASMAGAEGAPIPIIDTHLHLYDPTRPQGAPFPRTPNPRPFLPRDYREVATPLGITGGIKVE